jgi:hypothetical protein
MVTKTTLMGRGMPPGLANHIGFAINSVTGVGTAQTSGPTLEPQSINLLTTAGGATSCQLPAKGMVGEVVMVFAISATTGLVFPDAGSQIDLGTQDTGSVNVAQNKGRIFVRVAAAQWKSILGG